MINVIVKYQAGALGHFLSSILHNDIKPVATLDYGNIMKDKVLHTGSYDSPDETRFQEDIKLNTYEIVTHNNPKFEIWVGDVEQSKNIFIDLRSNFVEYRLNYIFKMPEWNNKLNRYATEDSWKDFEHPIANDDARRIVRLHQNKEQAIKQKPNDFVFPFANFYKEKNIWVDNFLHMAEKLDLNLSEHQLNDWHDCFKIGQKDILERGEHLRVCIQQGKFTNDLNENEKGIIIGHQAVKESRDDADFFDEIYSRFSTR
jgi:hypothetical protein